MQDVPDRRRRAALALPGAVALAATTAGATAATRPASATPPPPARVEAVQMPAWTEDAGGTRRALAPGDAIGPGTVATGPKAALVLRLADGTQVQLGMAATLQVQSLAVRDGAEPALEGRWKLVQGMLRFATGVVAAAVGHRQLEVELRTATIGIRGTDFWTMTDAQHDAVCLFEGRVQLATQEQGDLALEQPTAFWARFFAQAPQPVGNATPAQLSTFLASTALQRGQGIAVEGGTWRLQGAALADRAQAQAQVDRLQQAGYAAVLRRRGATAYAEIAQLATQADANALGARIGDLLPGQRVTQD